MSVQGNAQKAEKHGEKDLEGRRILVVDDEREFAESIQDLLEIEGTDVRIATDPADVMARLQPFDAEVVLLDIRLNRESGTDRIEHFQSIWPSARIIMITGFASKETAIAALKNGAFGYLEKPVHPDELRATIKRALWAYDADQEVRTSREKLVVSLNQAEAASRAKSIFLAHMSHELRTPLNAILGFSEIIRSEKLGDLSPSVYMEYAADIHDAGRHVLALVNDVLDYAGVDLGTKPLDEEWVDLIEPIDESCSLVATAANEQDITISRTMPSGSLRIIADRRMVKQMLVNLLDNAIKFSEPSGPVAIAVFRADDGDLVIEVRDNGIGINPDRLSDIIEPFTIAEPIDTRSHGGVGLGLSITKQLIERHGGRLSIASQVNEGTTASLIFPADRLEDNQLLSNVS